MAQTLYGSDLITKKVSYVTNLGRVENVWRTIILRLRRKYASKNLTEVMAGAEDIR